MHIPAVSNIPKQLPPLSSFYSIWLSFHNLWYADDTTLIEESEEELKSLLMKVKEESQKVVLKLNIQKNWATELN